jgi:hypothetical protein
MNTQHKDTFQSKGRRSEKAVGNAHKVQLETRPGNIKREVA